MRLPGATVAGPWTREEQRLELRLIGATLCREPAGVEVEEGDDDVA